MKGVEDRRSYSISSTSELNEPISFTVKRIDNGCYSRILYDQTKVGDVFFIAGVTGRFTLPVNTKKFQQYFFFAAGIGIGPVFPLIKSLLAKDENAFVTLIYSNRWQGSTIFYDELVRLAATYGNRFQVEFLYSSSKNLERARISKALLPVLMREYVRVPKSSILAYVCGPYNYMRMTILSLEEYGIDESNIRKENFRPFERPVIKTEPKDQKTYTVHLKLHDREVSFLCHYPDSILEAARKNGVLIPFSCESGRCASCAGRCVNGKVWMAFNEVLLDSDLEEGIVLTCSGHPIEGDVTIEI